MMTQAFFAEEFKAWTCGILHHVKCCTFYTAAKREKRMVPLNWMAEKTTFLRHPIPNSAVSLNREPA
jgi:hypothetical protein